MAALDRLRPMIRRHGKWLTIDWKDVERAHHWFDRHAVAVVLLGRLIPTIRSIVSIPAGLLDMRFRSFVLASTAGTALWTALLAFGGYRLQEKFERVGAIIGPVSSVVIGLIVIVYVWRLISHQPASEE
jgi:membrane protein DedA with SNARE-associated domain